MCDLGLILIFLELYEGMIGQSELPPLPLAYRSSELSCTLSPILSQSDRLSDNSEDATDASSSITQISKDFGECESEPDYFDDSLIPICPAVKFIKPLNHALTFENDLFHFVTQINCRPPGSQFIWRLNGRKLKKQTTLA